MDLQNIREYQRLLDCLNDLILHHEDWECHDPSGSGGTGGSGSTGATGKDGKSLEFKWQGTKLGVRVEGESTFKYVDLKGMDGSTPHIDTATGRWFVGTSDTGISATGLRGPDGKTPNFKIGTVTTLPAGSAATVSITGTQDTPVLNLGIPAGVAGDPATNTDEKLKLNASATSAQYLDGLIDNSTIVVDNTRKVIKAVTLEGLQATVTTLNFIKNLDKDIMTYLNMMSNPMTFRDVVADDAALQAYPNPQAGDTFIVKASASNGGKAMTFIYNGTSFEPFAETTISVRDFKTNPLDLATESTGNVPESRIDPLIARLSDVLTKAAYGGSDANTVKQADKLKGLDRTATDIEGLFTDAHTHANKALLDSLLNNGDEKKFLTNKGTYIGLYVVSSTAPTNTGIFWIDDSDATKPVLKFHNGTVWKPISSSGTTTSTTPVTVDTVMSSTSTNPVQNKVIKAYIDAITVPDISNAKGNALVEKTDGWYVEDPTAYIEALKEEIRILRKSQFHINTDLEYISLQIPATGDVGADQVIPLKIWNNFGNMELNGSNQIKLHAGKTYKIDTHISYSSTAGGVGKTSWANIQLMWKDITNNFEIGEVRQYIVADPNYEYNGSSSYLYTPKTDCYIHLYAKQVFITDRIDARSNATITEVGRAIQIDPVQEANANDGIEDTPLGTIIPLMGKNAPKHYLICDGSTKNIADYPDLAQYFKDEFGKINYFGGNGTTTFGVPDLRGEFLRGSGVATRNTGGGAAVGTHQEPTRHVYINGQYNGIICTTSSSTNLTTTSNNDLTSNEDKYFDLCQYKFDFSGGKAQPHGNRPRTYSARPTNTAVLWCIKAEPTYFLQVEGKDHYNPEKHLVGTWIDGKPLYEKTITMQGTAANKNVTVPTGITNYDTLFIYTAVIIDKTNNSTAMLPFNSTDPSDDIGIWTVDNDIVTICGRDRTNSTYVVNIRWTEK